MAASAVTGAKIFFIGNGERIDDLEEFSPTRFVGRLLGMGDIKAILDLAKDLELQADENQSKRGTKWQNDDRRLLFTNGKCRQNGI